MSLRALIFDVDDTLVYTFETALRRTRAAARALRVAGPSRAAFRADYGRADFAECVRRWFPDVDPQAFKRTYRAQASQFPYRSVTRFSSLQRSLAQRDLVVGVLTNGPRARTLLKLAVAEVQVERLAFLLCAEDLPQDKPSPAAFAPALERTGWPPAEHAYVADAPSDLSAARAAGLRFIGVRTGPHRCPARACDFTIESVTRLEECL